MVVSQECLVHQLVREHRFLQRHLHDSSNGVSTAHDQDNLMHNCTGHKDVEALSDFKPERRAAVDTVILQGRRLAEDGYGSGRL
jgi:hypothetical protein